MSKKSILIKYPHSNASGFKTLLKSFCYVFQSLDHYDYYFNCFAFFDSAIFDEIPFLAKRYRNRPFPTHDIEICISFPATLDMFPIYNISTEPEELNKIIFYTMWETDRLPSWYVNTINHSKAIFLPSDFCVDIFRNSGVNTEIKKINIGINLENFINTKSEKDNENFVIGIGRGPGYKNLEIRKNYDDFLSLFSKIFPNQNDVIVKFKSAKFVKKYVDNRIKLDNKLTSIEELAKWYGSLDLFISLAKGEGWGLMQHEAMACGVPVMGAIFNGLTEFMNEQNSIPINFTKEKFNLYNSDGSWCKLDMEDLKQKLLDCYHGKYDLKAMGQRAKKDASKFSIENMKNQFIQAMKELDLW